MAKDDYDIIAYRVLVYLYAVMKRKIMFETATFNTAVRKHVESDEYFAEVLQMMQNEGLIQGLVFITAWGGDLIIASDVENAKITVKGIHYLEENDKMKGIGEKLKGAVDIIAKLAGMIGLF